MMHIHASLNLEPLPEWAFHNFSGYIDEYWWSDYVDINVVNATSFEFVKREALWPLNVNYANGDRNSGYKIVGRLNASNFVDKQVNDDEDSIQLLIATFDTDPGGVTTDIYGLPAYFELSYFLQRFSSYNFTAFLNAGATFGRTRLNSGWQHPYILQRGRSENPCRNEYPTDLKRLLKEPLEPGDLYNSILAPDLPYDQRTCEHLCVATYWLSDCNCLMFDDVLLYAGSPANVTQCPYVIYNDTRNNCSVKKVFENTPAFVYERCKCYNRCERYAFVVAAYDKIRHTLGGKYCTEENSELRVKVFYTDLSYEVVEETESYPKEEMINELAGVCGLYFGFSVISLVSFCRLLIEKFRRVVLRENIGSNSKDLAKSIRSMKAHRSVIKVLQRMQLNYIHSEAKTEIITAIEDQIKQLELRNEKLVGTIDHLVEKMIALETYLEELSE